MGVNATSFLEDDHSCSKDQAFKKNNSHVRTDPPWLAFITFHLTASTLQGQQLNIDSVSGNRTCKTNSPSDSLDDKRVFWKSSLSEAFSFGFKGLNFEITTVLVIFMNELQ